MVTAERPLIGSRTGAILAYGSRLARVTVQCPSDRAGAVKIKELRTACARPLLVYRARAVVNSRARQ